MDNLHKDALQRSRAGRTLEHFSIISQEYLLHQISKLHDPAIQHGQINLSVEYMVRFGGWDTTTGDRLQELKSQLDTLADRVRPARHKVLSHNDLESILSGTTLGAFPAGADDDYFKALQEFVNVIQGSTIGGPSWFNDDACVDASEFLLYLQNACAT